MEKQTTMTMIEQWRNTIRCLLPQTQQTTMTMNGNNGETDYNDNEWGTMEKQNTMTTEENNGKQTTMTMNGEQWRSGCASSLLLVRYCLATGIVSSPAKRTLRHKSSYSRLSELIAYSSYYLGSPSHKNCYFTTEVGYVLVHYGHIKSADPPSQYRYFLSSCPAASQDP